MAILLENIKSGETVEISRQAQLSAYINSSDLNPNGARQDHGWRLGVDVIAEIDEIKADTTLVRSISLEKSIPVADLTTVDFLYYIVEQQAAAEELAAAEADTSSEIKEDYERRLREARKAKSTPKGGKKATAPKAASADKE